MMTCPRSRRPSLHPLLGAALLGLIACGAIRPADASDPSDCYELLHVAPLQPWECDEPPAIQSAPPTCSTVQEAPRIALVRANPSLPTPRHHCASSTLWPGKECFVTTHSCWEVRFHEVVPRPGKECWSYVFGRACVVSSGHTCWESTGGITPSWTLFPSEVIQDSTLFDCSPYGDPGDSLDP